MIFGYARVSTKDQNLELQLDAFKNYINPLTKERINKIYTEKISGKRSVKPELEKLLEEMREGDTLVIWRLDRLGRMAKELIRLAENLKERNINFISLTENLDTTTAMGIFVLNLFCLIAQMERDLLVERTTAGLEAARQRGRLGGRPKVPSTQIKKAIKMYKTRDFSIKEITETTGVSNSTLYRYLRKNNIET